MKEIKIMLDYQCYPLWLYDENGQFIDNEIPSEIKADSQLCNCLEEIQSDFESLFYNTSTEFRYIGFTSTQAKKAFEDKLNKIYKQIQTLVGKQYRVVNMVKMQKL